MTFVFEVLHTGLLEHSKNLTTQQKWKKASKDCVWSANVAVCAYIYIYMYIYIYVYVLLSQVLNISFETLSNQLDGFLLGSGPCLSNQAKGAYIQMRNTHEAQPQDESCRISHVMSCQVYMSTHLLLCCLRSSAPDKQKFFSLDLLMRSHECWPEPYILNCYNLLFRWD